MKPLFYSPPTTGGSPPSSSSTCLLCRWHREETNRQVGRPADGHATILYIVGFAVRQTDERPDTGRTNERTDKGLVLVLQPNLMACLPASWLARAPRVLFCCVVAVDLAGSLDSTTDVPSSPGGRDAARNLFVRNARLERVVGMLPPFSSSFCTANVVHRRGAAQRCAEVCSSRGWSVFSVKCRQCAAAEPPAAILQQRACERMRRISLEVEI